jgi:hypothetical protein
LPCLISRHPIVFPTWQEWEADGHRHGLQVAAVKALHSALEQNKRQK